MKKILLGIGLFSAGLSIGYFLSSTFNRNRSIDIRDLRVCDTIVIRDTMRMPIPSPRPDSVFVGHAVRQFPLVSSAAVIAADERDSFPDIGRTAVAIPDSVRVEIPIVRKVYADSSFRAVVSGFEPKLDSLVVYPRLIAVRPHTIRRPWGLGLNAGVCVGPRGVTPGVSVGVTYTFLSF